VLNLDERDEALLGGAAGDGTRLAMRIVVRMAELAGADRLLDVTAAHVDGCLDHGQAGLDFVTRLAEGGARAAVRTTLNVGSLDLLHPDLYRGDRRIAERARRLMDRYVELGCRPTWTCAPYQLPYARPALGEHVAWAESNAIVFANSVLGARTDRYGDFIDICAAVTGRVPDAGLHRTERRRAEVVVRLEGVGERLLREDALYPVLGHVVGRAVGTTIPVLVGLPGDVDEDALKALGAAAASAGSVAMFHAVGVTPEAPTLDAALQGADPVREEVVTTARLRAARDELTTSAGGDLGAVSVGTPHFSATELERLVALFDGRASAVPFFVSTGRDVLGEAERRGLVEALEVAGVTIVTDTCTYVTPILEPGAGPVMTSSGKWAYYAPGNLGIDVVFGSLTECVGSAVAGRVVRDEELWGGA
jgi:predicted aconitase